MSFLKLPLLLAINVSLASQTVLATTTGTLTFAGQVNGGTCDLSAGDVNRTITLPAIKISDFDASPSAGSLDFEVSADCESDIRTVVFQFAGTPAHENPILFSNTGTSSGTALWLIHRASPLYAIPANGTEAQRSRTVTTSGNKAVLPLSAAYYKTGAAVTQGTLASAVTVSITYN
ncbi:fimbrial protein [Pseudomonas sp. H2_H09]